METKVQSPPINTARLSPVRQRLGKICTVDRRNLKVSPSLLKTQSTSSHASNEFLCSDYKWVITNSAVMCTGSSRLQTQNSVHVDRQTPEYVLLYFTFLIQRSFEHMLFEAMAEKIQIGLSDSGQVILEVKSRVGKSCDNNQFDKTKKLIRISSDGMQIEVCNEVAGTLSIDGCSIPMPPQPSEVYTYPDMPEKLLKKYHHAYKFVEVIKSVTPKVTLLTDRARCKLMENSPIANFQACFHNGVILLFSKMKITLTERDGSSLTFHEDLASSHVSPDTLALLEYSLQCRDQCLQIEKTVTSLQSRNPHQDLFPILIGSNNQPYLPSLNQQKQLPVKQETGCGDVHHSSNLRTTFLNQGCILQPQNNVNTGTNNYKQAACSGESQRQIQKPIHVLNDGTSECPHPQNNLYLTRDKLYFYAKMPEPCQSSDAHNTSQGLKLQSACPTKETQDRLLDNSASFGDLSDSNSSCSYSINHSALSTPLKLNKTASLQSGNSSRMHTNLSPIAVKPAVLTKVTNCEDQLPDWQNISGHITNTGFINKFQAECKIPENFNDSYLLSENSSSANDQLTFSPSCQTRLCDNTHSKPNMPDYYTTQFQNPFLTPQKSQVACDTYHYPYSDGVLRCRYKTPIRYDSKVDERQLRNVKRNLFSDQTSEELKCSPVSTSPSNILMHGMINFSDCSSNASLVYQNTEFHTSSQPCSCDSGMSVEDSLPTSASQLEPGKASHVMKSIVRYSPCSGTPADIHTESVALPSYSDTSSVHNSTRSIELSLSFSEDTNSTENSNIISAHSAAFVKPVTHEQFSKPFPENCTSPRKSTPLRKVVSLSPYKTCNIQGIPTMEYTEKMSADFLPFHYQTSPVTSNKSSPCDSSESSINNYQTVQSLENLSSAVPEFATLNQPTANSHPGMPLCKDFPSISRSSNNWNGLDLPLSRHSRHSLDMSSDDCSSSPPSSTSDVICQVFVPYTGWAALYATGTVWILYNDGTQLGVKSTEATVIYVGQDGGRARYKNTDVVPEIVKLKLEKLPKVIDLIKKSQETGFSGVQLWQS